MPHPPYEIWDDTMRCSSLWDSSRIMPARMPMSEFDQGFRTLIDECAQVDDYWRREAEERYRNSDHDGEYAHPFDASQLHVWRLWLLERGRVDGGPDTTVWQGADGIVNAIVDAQEKIGACVESLMRAGGWPMVRVWVRTDPKGMPFRFVLARI